MPFDLQCRLQLGGSPGSDLVLVATSGWLLKALDFLSVTPAPATIPLSAYEVHSYLNPFVFDKDTVVGDLTESVYPGYASQVGNPWSPVGTDDNDNVVCVADLPAPWQVTGDPAGELLAGVYVLDGDGDLAFGVGLTEPIALVNGLLIPATLIIQLGNLD